MSTPSSHVYETVYILKPGITESDATTIHTKIDSVVSKFEGQLRMREDMGIRELAYPIHKEGSGRYSLIVYSGKRGVVEEIERHFRILDDVIRHMTLQVAEDYDYPKVKKQILHSEEEARKAREARKKL